MKKFIALLITICLCVTVCVPAAYAAPGNGNKGNGCPANRVVVTQGGSGPYACDGIDDQVEINAALRAVEADPDLTTVYLSSGRYVIDAPLYIGSDTTLTGDPDTVLTIKNGAIWPIYQPMITQVNQELGYLGVTRNSGIRICGFTIDGNRLNDAGTPMITQGINASGAVVTILSGGQYYYTMMDFLECEDIRVERMVLRNNHNDALKLTRCHYIYYNDNLIDRIGHDGLYTNRCTYIQARRNRIHLRINSGLRLYNSNHAVLSNNVITSTPADGGGAGIQIQKLADYVPMNDILIKDNVIEDTMLAGIWVFGSHSYLLEDASVHIQGNRLVNTGLRSTSARGGIVTAGFNLHVNRNEFINCRDATIAIRNAYTYPALGGPYQIKVNNNKIWLHETSVAILNALSDQHVVQANNNRIEPYVPPTP